MTDHSDWQPDQAPPPAFAIRQNDIYLLSNQGRLGDYPVAVRTSRQVAGGGFANPEAHPNSWIVYFLVDGQWALLVSARGLRREWSSLDRLEKWFRSHGMRYFWVRNEIDFADEAPEEVAPTETPA